MSLPKAHALGVGPPYLELDLLPDGSNSTMVYVTSDGMSGMLIIGREDLPFRVEPSEINITSSDVSIPVELTFYGNETLEPGVYIGLVTFYADTGGFIAYRIRIWATINLLGEAQEEEPETPVEEEPEPEVEEEPKKPFEVIVNDFQVHPLAQEVEDKDDVWTFRISYNVTNIGDYYGNYRVRSFVNKQLVDSEVFFLEAGENQGYLFEVELGVGKYEVEVEDFTESIEVCYEPKVTDYVPYVVIGSIVALGLIGIWWKRR